MSIMEIPDEMFAAIYLDQVAQLIDAGMFVSDAKVRARELMGQCFVSRTIAECQENEKDRWEYLDEMSLGGPIFKEGR